MQNNHIKSLDLSNKPGWIDEIVQTPSFIDALSKNTSLVSLNLGKLYKCGRTHNSQLSCKKLKN